MHNPLYILIVAIIVIPCLIGFIAIGINRLRNKSTYAATSPYKGAFLFHSVENKVSLYQSNIYLKKFRSILGYIIDQNYQTITIYHYTQLIKNKIELSKDTPVLSLVFDDGFENFYRNAFPLLDEFGLTFSLFPVITFANKKSTWDVFDSHTHLTKEQIREIASKGHEIGSHTLSHPDLRLLSDKAMEYELRGSKQILEDLTGKLVTTLSFPFGSWNNHVWDIARSCGYTAAVAYRNVKKTFFPIIPVYGIYQFDTLSDVKEKIELKNADTHAWLRTSLLPHFAKGTPLWKYRRSYSVLRLCKR